MISKDEYKTMVQRLKNLNKDLNGTGDDETDFFVKLCRLYEDKKVNLMEIYAKYYSGAKVTDTAYIPAGTSDMSDYMIHFSEGYDIFVKKIEKHYLVSGIQVVHRLVKRHYIGVLTERSCKHGKLELST